MGGFGLCGIPENLIGGLVKSGARYYISLLLKYHHCSDDACGVDTVWHCVMTLLMVLLTFAVT